MKRMLFITALLAAAALLLLAGCSSGGSDAPTVEPEPEPDGGVKEDTDYEAPKEIESTQIISFSCEFSGYDLSEDDSRLAGRAFLLEAVLRDGAVRGSYRSHTPYDYEELPFRASHSFMAALQKVAAEYDLAQYNGLSHHVSGLPEDYGAYLTVMYASGESIDAGDNESCFLSIEAMEALEALFRNYAEPNPTAIDLSVSTEFTADNVNGCFISVSYPTVTLGHHHWDGNYRNGQGYEALNDALDAYNFEVQMEQESMYNYTLSSFAGNMTGGEFTELYSLRDVYVTRSDSRVVSFYEALRQYTGYIPEQQYRRAFNFDTVTGKKLTYADVFTDTGELANILAKAFVEAAPELEISNSLAEDIGHSIQAENIQICFALANGGVHFFAEKNPLGGSPGIVHVMLSYRDYPELVKDFYRPEAKSWVTKLEYDTDYVLPDGTPLRMSWEVSPETDWELSWTVNVGERGKKTEYFYGSAPACHLVQMGRRSFLYAEVPSGDISYSTRIYEVTPERLIEVCTVDAVIYDELNSNPKSLLMVENDYVCAGSVILLPYGVFTVGDDGIPALSGDEYGLMAPDLRLITDVEATAADQFDPTIEDGPMPLTAGTVLTPFRTDKESYIDFFDSDGNVCRFAIDGFTDDMSLNNYGTLEELMEICS